MTSKHIIANFMGLTHKEETLVPPHGSQQEVKYFIYYDGNKEITFLKYDTSWDALIPVISKLNSYFSKKESDLTNEDYDIFTGNMIDLTYYITNNNIDEAYKFVLELIDLHNKLEN